MVEQFVSRKYCRRGLTASFGYGLQACAFPDEKQGRCRGYLSRGFLRLVKSNTQFESSQHLKAWLIKATLNCCKSLWCSAWFRHTQPLDENLPEPTRVNDNDLYVKVMELSKSLA